LTQRLRDTIKVSTNSQDGKGRDQEGLAATARLKIAAYVREKDRTGVINLKAINGQLIGKTLTDG
jgi:hypothetical protein